VDTAPRFPADPMRPLRKGRMVMGLFGGGLHSPETDYLRQAIITPLLEPQGHKVFRQPPLPLPPMGMLSLTDLVDRVGRSLHGSSWPDITKPLVNIKYLKMSGIFGNSFGENVFPTESSQFFHEMAYGFIDPKFNEIIDDILVFISRLIYRHEFKCVCINEKNGFCRKIPNEIWMSIWAINIIKTGQIVSSKYETTGEWVFICLSQFEEMERGLRQGVGHPLLPTAMPQSASTERNEAAKKKPLPEARRGELVAFLKQGNFGNADDARTAAEAHFPDWRISREMVREIRSEEDLLGQRGRKRRRHPRSC